MKNITEIKGSLSDTSAFEARDPRFAKAFEFLRRPDLADLPDGRHEIDGDEIFAMISSPALKPFGTGKVESHRKYIDIHYSTWKRTSWCSTPTRNLLRSVRASSLSAIRPWTATLPAARAKPQFPVGIGRCVLRSKFKV